MKRTIYLLSALVIMLLVNCTTDNNEIINPKNESTETPLWLSQLTQVNANLKGSRSNSSDLYLVNYNYKSKIETEAQKSELLKELFAANTKMVLPLDDKGKYYEILPFEEIKQKMESYGVKNPGKYIELQLDTIIKIGQTDVIDLEWCYKGDNFHSTAIASKKQGILYDHIGSMIITSPNEQSLEYIPIKTRKSRSEGEGGLYERSFVLQNDGGYNALGQKIWEYTISCYSYFDKDGILSKKNVFATHHSSGGWNCDANARTINGEIGRSYYHEFAWGHTHALGISVSVQFNGFEFTLSPGGDGATGTSVHRK